jgi:dTDP-4-amino-4,6-dideoxygalactose transaminase
MAEQADAQDLKSCGALPRAGSIPAPGTSGEEEWHGMSGKKIRIPLASPAWEHGQLRAKIEAAVLEALVGGAYILGPQVGAFEKRAAGYLGLESAIGVSSGTDALLMVLMGLGVGPGDEVVTTAFSFIATSSVIARVGATPVFVDIEEDGFNLDPDLLERALTKKTRALLVVHLFGQTARMDPILELAAERNLAVIEDCAQAFGARHGGRLAGTMGDFGCFSFFPAKPLGGAGDAGLVVCSDARMEKLLRQIRVQGASGKNIHPVLGGNFRLDTLQAAILEVKLEAIDGWIETRRKNAARYAEKLSGLGDRVVLPAQRQDSLCVWAQFSILARRRDELERFLLERGIGCAVYYPLPLPFQESMKGAARPKAGDFPRAERAGREILSIPVHPCLSTGDVEEVAQTIIEFYNEKD